MQKMFNSSTLHNQDLQMILKDNSSKEDKAKDKKISNHTVLNNFDLKVFSNQ